ncbi:MAG: hypothetical protein K0U98_22360 [Deltaproteobacteria bacterium]|nr:hypothetical protein [Deltaproteobacteria bacterium]
MPFDDCRQIPRAGFSALPTSSPSWMRLVSEAALVNTRNFILSPGTVAFVPLTVCFWEGYGSLDPEISVAEPATTGGT